MDDADSMHQLHALDNKHKRLQQRGLFVLHARCKLAEALAAFHDDHRREDIAGGGAAEAAIDILIPLKAPRHDLDELGILVQPQL